MYLKKKNIPFSIRIPNNTQVRTKKGKKVKASALFLLGVAQTCALTDARSVWGESVYLPCFRSRQEHVIIASDRCAHNALVEYQQRWQIERLFQALKGRGFDMEKTHLTKPDRVEKLLVLVSLTFCWCYQIGHEQQKTTPIKKKNHGHPSKSVFRLGLETVFRVVLNIGEQQLQWQMLLQSFRQLKIDLLLL